MDESEIEGLVQSTPSRAHVPRDLHDHARWRVLGWLLAVAAVFSVALHVSELRAEVAGLRVALGRCGEERVCEACDCRGGSTEGDPGGGLDPEQLSRLCGGRGGGSEQDQDNNPEAQGEQGQGPTRGGQQQQQQQDGVGERNGEGHKGSGEGADGGDGGAQAVGLASVPEPLTHEHALEYKTALAGSDGCGSPSGKAYVTLCTNTNYVGGVLVLAEMLQRMGAQQPLIVMVTSKCDTFGTRLDLLARDGVSVCRVHYISNPHPPRPGHYFTDTYNKLNLFALPLRVAVYLDADTLPVNGLERLFGVLGESAVMGASCDTGRSRVFNSGLMVTKPATVDFADMLGKVKQLQSADFGDQGFLASYFLGNVACSVVSAHPKIPFVQLNQTDEWERTKTEPPSFLVLNKWMEELTEPADLQLRRGLAELNHLSDMSVIHFLGEPKPWLHCKDAASCNTRIGRGPYMDQLYFAVMEDLGVWWTSRLGVGTGVVFSPSDLNLGHLHRICPEYDSSTTAPNRHENTLCTDKLDGNEADEADAPRTTKPAPATVCSTGPFAGRFLAGCALGCAQFDELEAALERCQAGPGCGGVTHVARTGRYELRRDKTLKEGDSHDTSWVLAPCDEEQAKEEVASTSTGGGGAETAGVEAAARLKARSEKHDLAFALANTAPSSCDSPCAFSLSNAGVAWRWNTNQRCWARETHNGVCFQGKGFAAATERTSASFVHSALYHAPVDTVCERLR